MGLNKIVPSASLKALLLLMLGCIGTTSANAAMTVVCRDMSPVIAIAREGFPDLGIDIFVLDEPLGQVQQIAGSLKENAPFGVSFTPASIRFQQAGHIQHPELRESFESTMSRVDGSLVRVPIYTAASGERIFGEALQKRARELNLTGPTGVNPSLTRSTCEKDPRRF